GGHAGAKTVDALALEIAGLKRSFHGGNFRILRTTIRRKGRVGKRTRDSIESSVRKQTQVAKGMRSTGDVIRLKPQDCVSCSGYSPLLHWISPWLTSATSQHITD